MVFVCSFVNWNKGGNLGIGNVIFCLIFSVFVESKEDWLILDGVIFFILFMFCLFVILIWCGYMVVFLYYFSNVFLGLVFGWGGWNERNLMNWSY